MPEQEVLTAKQEKKEKQIAAKSRKAVDQSFWSLVRHQFKKNKIALAAFYIILVLFIVAIFADFLAYDKPIIAKYNGTLYVPPVKDYLVGLGLDRWPQELANVEWKDLDAQGKLSSTMWPPVRYWYKNQDLVHNTAHPGGDHPLGTDFIGRDVLSGIIHGSRIALTIGFLSMAIATLLGILMGAMAGFYGGKVDTFISFIIEVIITLPTFFLIITIVAIVPGSIWLVMGLIGFVNSPNIARFTRGEFLRIRNMEYVSAATATGLSNNRVIFKHVLPNSLAPVLVYVAFGIAGAILTEAGLSFLGFGVPPDIVTWGSVLNEARGDISAWWLAVFPGFMIFLSVLCYNLVGDGLRDALDPRLRD
jgi:peptide/nickel transport system permease protein